jgi:hypothetical protein
MICEDAIHSSLTQRAFGVDSKVSTFNIVENKEKPVTTSLTRKLIRIFPDMTVICIAVSF